MPQWSSGYNVDVAYTYGFYDEMAPHWLSFVATFDGVACPDGAWRYLELGCGNGFGLIILAALYPDHDFVGIDFEPGHIAHATNLARAAGLDNVTFIEADFRDLAKDWPKAWGQFDFVTAHGVISWIEPDIRHAVMTTIGKATRPGALSYLSYDCMPGQASALPIQHLFRLWQTTEGMSPTDAVAAGMKRMQGLVDAGSRMTTALPSIQPRISKMQSSRPNYLIHEFLNDNWHPLWFDQVARETQDAKLTFLGSTILGDRYAAAVLPAQIYEILNVYTDPVIREVMLDVFLNRRFRSDVFVKGAVPLWSGQQQHRLGETLLNRDTRHASEGITFKILKQTVSGTEDTFRPLIDLLKTGPKAIAELSGISAPSQKTLAQMKKISMYLLQSGIAYLYVPIADKAPAKALNRIICEAVAEGAPYRFIIATETGAVLKPRYTDMIMLADMMKAPTPLAVDVLAGKLINWHEKRGQAFVNPETKTSPEGGVKSYATALASAFLSRQYPEWKDMGVF